MGSNSKRTPWPGGYIHKQKDGRDLFIIEREVSGRRFHVSTRTHSLKAAMKHLERFEADPLGYNPAGVAAEEPLYLTQKLAEEFRDWQLARDVTAKHAKEVGNRLADWIEDLAHVDLRRASLRDHIVPALEKRKTMRAARISTIKSFYGWLRKEKHVLTSAEDCTQDLPVPQARPEKYVRRKAVPLESLRAVAEHLVGAYRDMLTVLGATGWHVTELGRFVRHEAAGIVYAKREATIAVLLTPHKGGESTRTPVTDPEVLAAAERLRARGRLPKKPNEALKAACDVAGVKPAFTFGVMRHTVGTLAVEAGADPAKVSEFLGHRDPRTTKRFYIDVAVPTTTVALPKLRLVKG